ncbi:MAG: oligosaccharide flippase family protein [Planctomycetota bacterium]|jgi:O-antigen/teichoic acid export membrane protein|nr:oligosaccharide flippase family protein [Planctomycetota bacterium]
MLGILGGRMAQPFFTFFLFFVSARILTTAQFGVYVLLMGLLVLFQSMNSLGLERVLAREIGQHPDEEGATIASVLCLSLPASIVSGVLFLVLVWTFRSDYDLFPLTAIAIISLPFSAAFQFAESAFAAHNAGGRLFRISLVEQFVRVALSIAALLAGFGLYGLLGSYVLGRIIAGSGASYVFFRKSLAHPLRLDRRNLRYIWGRLAAFVPMTLLGNLYYRADVIVLAYLLTESDIGIYGCAMRIVGFGFIVPESVVSASFPHFSRHLAKRDAVYETKTSSFLDLLLASGFLGSAGMAVFGGLLLTLFFGVKYAASGPILAILAFMLPAYGVNVLAGLLFQAAHREKTALALVAVAVAVAFGSIALGAFAGGVSGAAIGNVLSMWLMALVHLALSRRANLMQLTTKSPASRSLVWLAAATIPLAGVPWQSGSVFCLAAAVAALIPLFLGGLAGTLAPRRIRKAFA